MDGDVRLHASTVSSDTIVPMPELPEVESVRRVFERVLSGRKIVSAEVAPDEIVLGGMPHGQLAGILEGAEFVRAGRKGKYWWLELDRGPVVFGHLGMAGWVRELGAFTPRLREHGNAPLDDESGRPRFLKLLLTTDAGGRVAMTDGRRLARLWIGESPEADKRVRSLGPDAWTELPDVERLMARLKGRQAPIKALLLDQSILFSGVGNWIADEILYQAGIRPDRLGASLAEPEVDRMRERLREVLDRAIADGADSEKYPKHWLFHYRWGGAKGSDMIEGRQIVRATVGGRTTAWVPELQS